MQQNIVSKEKNTNTKLGKHVCTKGQAKKDKLLPSSNTSIKTRWSNDVFCCDIVWLDFNPSQGLCKQGELKVCMQTRSNMVEYKI